MTEIQLASNRWEEQGPVCYSSFVWEIAQKHHPQEMESGMKGSSHGLRAMSWLWPSIE